MLIEQFEPNKAVEGGASITCDLCGPQLKIYVIFFLKAAAGIRRALIGSVIPTMNEIRGVHMSFYKEPTHYKKTALSDLQGAQTIFRDTVEVCTALNKGETD